MNPDFPELRGGCWREAEAHLQVCTPKPSGVLVEPGSRHGGRGQQPPAAEAGGRRSPPWMSPQGGLSCGSCRPDVVLCLIPEQPSGRARAGLPLHGPLRPELSLAQST